MQTVSFLQKGDSVNVVVNGRLIMALGWKASAEACRALDQQLRDVVRQKASAIAVPIGETGIKWRGVGIAFRQEIDKIVVLGGNPERLLFDMNTIPTAGGGPSIARQLWSAWLGVTKLAEEWATAPKVARDAAILHRSGAPIGIANHPAIRKEAQSIARHDRDLRRFMADNRTSVKTNGVSSDEVLGAPTIGIDTRTPKQRLAAELAKLPPEMRKAALAAAMKSG